MIISYDQPIYAYQVRLADSSSIGNLPILLKDDRTPSASRRTSASSNHSKKDPLLVAPPGFHPNLNFVGMTEELRALNVRLFKEKRAERLLAALICGVSGSGKTHLARQYVWTHRGSFPGGIFWVDAKSTQSRYKCFWDIAQAATIHEGKEFGNADTKSNHNYVDAVRDWLQSREEWLLVFDGLNFDHEDDLDSFKQFLPFNKKCNIIYTSVDRTLRKRQRLFEPHTVHVRPLRIEDACKLLFKDLDIRRPTPDQVRKATELVEHYEGLPLAIHAISHRLSATSKPIEKYHIDSHLTDEKLAEPFLGIMHDLYRMGHFEALNLINVMSFLGHHIPVGLLILGRAVLETWNVEILTPSRPGAHGDIDTTLGILIRCGLIERTTESYSVSSPKGRSYDDTLVKAVAPDLSESQTESSQETFFSANQSTRTIDVIKMHSVIQGFCRDELTIMDDERQMTSPGSTEASFYESWLVVATRVLCTSYENGRAKMMRDTLVRDYREYETHASRLMEHFPKKPPESQLVAETMEDLKLVIGSIGCQLSKASPSPSQESIQKQRSVFDRSSSSSSSAPDSSADEGCARQVWDWSDGTSFKVESPGEISVGPHYFNLKPFLPHTYREPTMSREDGYETDGEGPKFRISPALSQGSHATEKAKSSPASSPPQMDDKEWNLKEKHSKSKLGKDKLKRRKRLPHDFRKPKPAVPMLNVFQVAGRGASSPMMNTGRRGSLESSEAKKSLRAMGEGSRGRQTKSADYSIFGKENMPTYVTTAASHALGEEQGRYSQRSLSLRGQGQSLSPGLQPKPSGESLESRIASMQPSRLSSELKPEEIGQPSGGAHYDFNRPRLNIMDTRTAPGTRYHSRRPSSAGYEPVGDMTASAPSLVSYYPQPIPYETDITVTEPQRRLGSPPGGQLASSSPSSHPSAFMPGVSPPHSHTTDAPTGYVSDPVLSEPMSRDPSNQSNQSNQSWSTEPARYPPRLSPLQSNQGFPPPFSQHPQHLLTETGGWVGDTHSQVSALPEPPHSRIRPVGFDEHLFGRFYTPSPELPPSGYYDRHPVHSDRDRLPTATYSRYPIPHQAPAYSPYRSNHPAPPPPPPFVNTEQIIPPKDGRARSGSSPAKPGFHH